MINITNQSHINKSFNDNDNSSDDNEDDDNYYNNSDSESISISDESIKRNKSMVCSIKYLYSCIDITKT
jgi:hypothetical protein